MSIVLITYGEDYEEGVLIKVEIPKEELTEVEKYFKDFDEALLDSNDTLVIDGEEFEFYLIKSYEIIKTKK